MTFAAATSGNGATLSTTASRSIRTRNSTSANSVAKISHASTLLSSTDVYTPARRITSVNSAQKHLEPRLTSKTTDEYTQVNIVDSFFTRKLLELETFAQGFFIVLF